MSQVYSGHRGRNPLAMVHSADRTIAMAEETTGIDRVELLKQAIGYLAEAKLFGCVRAIERLIDLEDVKIDVVENDQNLEILGIAPKSDVL